MRSERHREEGPPTLKLAPPLKRQRHADGGRGISPTHAEQTANELKAFIQKNGVTRMYPMKVGGYFPSQFSANQGIVWSFSNGFIYMDYSGGSSVGYNLDYLVYYSILNVPLNNGKYEAALILILKRCKKIKGIRLRTDLPCLGVIF